LELGRRLRRFREAHALTQAEVAAAVGASDKSAVSQWEAGVTVPDGMRRERLVELLEGRLWPQLRTAVVDMPGMPPRWAEAVRRYRRASRGRGARLGVGTVLSAVLQVLREVDSPDGLRERYRAEPGEWASRLAPDCNAEALCAADRRCAEEAGFGLRWLELERGLRFDTGRSLVDQLPLTLLDGAVREGPSEPGA
jgi:transcriptional regulator with XRE-family HTH domain